MPNIWIDVTTIWHWRRPPVGVVRVEAECFKYFAQLGRPDVRFCRFDREARAYLEVLPQEVQAIVDSYGVPPPQAGSAPPVATAKRASESAEKVLSKLATPLQAPVRKLARKTTPVLRTVLHHYRRASTRVSQFSNELEEMSRPLRKSIGAAPIPAPAPFGRGDVLVSAGLDWDQKDRGYLYELKLTLGLKLLLFCYDLIPVLYPHLCVGEVAGMFARYFVDVAWCADEVMCISKSSQRDLLALLRETGAPEPKTSLVRLGSNLPTAHAQDDVEKLITGKYLLFVSTIERRKNHEVIYRAIAQLVEQGRTELPMIVFVGMMGWGVKDFISDLSIDPRVRGRFALLNHVSDAQLSQLYAGAEFTLYPSLYEGWGLPLAESLAHGKFALASNTSSLPEVGGSLVEYIDPWESRRWAERIAYYLDHPEALAEKEKAIREGYQVSTWQSTGRQVFEAAAHLLVEGTSAQAGKDATR